MSRIQIAIYVLLGVALAISVVTDLRTRKIFDVVTLPVMGLCLLLRLLGNLESGAWWGSWNGPGLAGGLLGLGIGGVFFLVMCLMGGMGMGDVKLTAAVGAGVGCPGILACLIFIGLVGGLEALVVLVWQGKLLKTFGGMFKGALQKTKILKPDNQPREHTKIPYGVAIALGTAWGMWWTMQAGAAPN